MCSIPFEMHISTWLSATDALYATRTDVEELLKLNGKHADNLASVYIYSVDIYVWNNMK